MRLTRSIVLGAAFVALTTATGFAQTTTAGAANGPYLRLEGGWSHPGDMDGSAAAGIPSGESSRDEGYIAGGAAGYKFGPWRAELNLDYSENDMKSGTNVFVHGGSGSLSGDSSNLSLMVNGYYDFATGTPWTPYLGFGIGGTNFSLDNVRTSSTRISNSSAIEFAYQPIVGISYQIDPNWSANAEYRYFSSTDASLPYAPGGKFSVSNASHNFLIGVTYHFAAPPPPPPPVPAAAAAPAAAPAPAAKQTFLVFFEFDRASLTRDGQKVVDEAAAAYKKEGHASVSVAGYTDLAGTQAYNLRLSRRRADVVRAALVKDGVPAGVIDVSAYGKEHPRVPTANGVREPQNRRVEITF